MRPTKKISSQLLGLKLTRASSKPMFLSTMSLFPIWSRTSFKRRGINTTAVFSCLGVLLTTILTIVYFIAIRQHDVQLSFQQMSMLERRVHRIGNHTLYIVQLPTTDEFLTEFSADDWKKLSISRVDFVAFIYDDMQSFVSTFVSSPLTQSSPTIEGLLDKFQTLTPQQLSIVLFPCGCIIPNFMFMHTNTRFDGHECQMLPGFIMPKEAVAFVNLAMPSGTCRSREAVLAAPWYTNYVYKLQKARDEYVSLRHKLESGKLSTIT